MKHCFDIKPYVNFEKTQFYTIEELGKGVNETDEFFIRFKDDPDYQKDIETINTGFKKSERNQAHWKGILDRKDLQRQFP